jgi:hypothetical protein
MGMKNLSLFVKKNKRYENVITYEVARKTKARDL